MSMTSPPSTTDHAGLTTDGARSRLERNGPNRLPERDLTLGDWATMLVVASTVLVVDELRRFAGRRRAGRRARRSGDVTR